MIGGSVKKHQQEKTPATQIKQRHGAPESVMPLDRPGESYCEN